MVCALLACAQEADDCCSCIAIAGQRSCIRRDETIVQYAVMQSALTAHSHCVLLHTAVMHVLLRSRTSGLPTRTLTISHA